MKLYFYNILMLLLICGVASSNGFAKDVDAQSFLNQKLSSKPSLRLSKPVSVITKTCKTIRPSSGSGHGRRAGEGDPEDHMPITVCTDTVNNSIQQYESSATAISSRVVKVDNLTFSSGQIVTLPEKALLSYVDFQNCSDFSLSRTITTSVSGTKGFMVSKGESVTTTKNASVSFSASFNALPGSFGGSASTSFGISEAIALSSQTQESSSTAVSLTESTTVSVPPRASGRVEMLAYETTIEIPFSALVVVDGEIAPNDSGVNLASQLLSEDERTLPFNGILRITNVSNANIKATKAPKPFQCGDEDKNLTLVNLPYFSVPAKSLTKDSLKAFSSPQALFSKIKPANRNAFSTEILADVPQIGPADGVGYEVISITDIAKSDPMCGFNDLGIMNLGLFSVETRRYTQYSNGTMVSSWIDKVETFKSCWPQ